MTDKTIRQDLIDFLIEHHQMEPADAEAFVKAFFTLIEEALVRDRYVKIKGLGTFKLIEVNARESVDVNTGERIQIKEYTKVSFIPEASVRDAVNKPFAHFETVLLKDDVHFSDMPESSENEENTVEEQDVPSAENTSNSVLQSEPVSEVPSRMEKNIVMRLPWCMISAILLLGVLVGGIVAWMLGSGRRYIPESMLHCYFENQKPAETISSDKPDSVMLAPVVTVAVRTDSVSKKSVTKTDEKGKTAKEEISIRKENLSDTVEYDMTGTKTTYTLRSGESLARISLKFYGNKKLWPYLARYNKQIIKNPNNVPVGTTIRIPVLVPKRAKSVERPSN